MFAISSRQKPFCQRFHFSQQQTQQVATFFCEMSSHFHHFGVRDQCIGFWTFDGCNLDWQVAAVLGDFFHKTWNWLDFAFLPLLIDIFPPLIQHHSQWHF